jgi:hypothetical protein
MYIFIVLLRRKDDFIGQIGLPLNELRPGSFQYLLRDREGQPLTGKQKHMAIVARVEFKAIATAAVNRRPTQQPDNTLTVPDNKKSRPVSAPESVTQSDQSRRPSASIDGPRVASTSLGVQANPAVRKSHEITSSNPAPPPASSSAEKKNSKADANANGAATAAVAAVEKERKKSDAKREDKPSIATPPMVPAPSSSTDSASTNSRSTWFSRKSEPSVDSKTTVSSSKPLVNNDKPANDNGKKK